MLIQCSTQKKILGMHSFNRVGKTLSKEKNVKRSENKVNVKIRVPIHPFGFFTFKELGSTQKEATKIKSPSIYVFPKSTAAIAQA